jgi:hypothetical protein
VISPSTNIPSVRTVLPSVVCATVSVGGGAGGGGGNAHTDGAGAEGLQTLQSHSSW